MFLSNFRLTAVRPWSAIALGLLLMMGTGEDAAFPQARYSLTALLRCSREEAILKAFSLMKDGAAEESLRRIVGKPMRVVFKDMKAIHKSLKNYDALSWISSQGEQVLFLNEKHRNAPAEALAALIAHEAMHDDPQNSINEEIQSWAHEAIVWREMKAHNPNLARIPAGMYSLVDRENRIETEYSRHTLASFVRENPGYQGLPETSPGFAAVQAGL